MSNQNKKDPLEEFFRKKVWDYDISYNEADWMELEDRLDILDKQYMRRNRRRWIAAASILLFCLLGYFTYQNYTKIGDLSRQLNQETLQQRAQNELNEPGVTGSDRPDADEDRPDNPSDNAGDALANAGRDTRGPASDRQRTEAPQQEADSENEEIDTGEGAPAPGNFWASGLIPDQLSVSELTTRDHTLSGIGGDNEPPAHLNLTAFESETQNRTPVLAAGSEPATPGQSPQKPSRQLPSSRFAVGLVVSPDLSTVGSISNFYEPGYKIGLEMEYRLTRNLGITAGVIQSKVRYTARGNEYSPPQGYWSGGVLPSETVGVCSLIDIPISLKYNFLQMNRSRLFVTAGLSSYIMQSEDYRFDYANGYSGQVQSWSENTGTRHWFSNANFSLGYEFDLRSNWSLKAEPFIKVPLKEVGWGNVKLYSLGSFVSINYKIQ